MSNLMEVGVEIDAIWRDDEKLARAIGDMLLNDSESRRAFLKEMHSIGQDHVNLRAQTPSELGISTVVHEAVRDMADGVVSDREEV